MDVTLVARPGKVVIVGTDGKHMAFTPSTAKALARDLTRYAELVRNMAGGVEFMAEYLRSLGLICWRYSSKQPS